MNKETNFLPLMLLVGLPLMVIEIVIVTIVHIVGKIKIKSIKK